MYKYQLIVISQCKKINELWQTGHRRAALLRATRLWNVIDCRRDVKPEYMWTIMLGMIPFVFDDPRKANSLKFCYPVWRCAFNGRHAIVSAKNASQARFFSHDDLHSGGGFLDLAAIEVVELYGDLSNV
jgi:hypothetical protein